MLRSNIKKKFEVWGRCYLRCNSLSPLAPHHLLNQPCDARSAHPQMTNNLSRTQTRLFPVANLLISRTTMWCKAPGTSHRAFRGINKFYWIPTTSSKKLLQS